MNTIENFKIGIDELAQWGNALREITTHERRTRALDAIWWGQLLSKSWLINHLKDWAPDTPSNIYIFGGWIGMLANMMWQSPIKINKIRSIDIDPWCEPIADRLNTLHLENWDFKAITADMVNYQYVDHLIPDIVINTITEHIDQETYDRWLDGIPQGTIVVTQGNDFYDCDEHIRCAKTLDDFINANRAGELLWQGSMNIEVYNRWMAIWRR